MRKMRADKVIIRADKVIIRKGDWVKVRSLDSNLAIQGLVYSVDKTHISIKPARGYLRAELRRETIEVLDMTHRNFIDNWWNFL